MGEKHDLLLSDFVEYRESQLNEGYKCGIEEPYNVYGSRGFVDFYVLNTSGLLDIYEIKASIEEFYDVGSIVRQTKKYLEFFTKKFPQNSGVAIFLVLPPDKGMVEKIRDTLPLFKQMKELRFIIFSKKAYSEHGREYRCINFPLTYLEDSVLREYSDYRGLDDKEFFYKWIIEGIDVLKSYEKKDSDRYLEYLNRAEKIHKEHSKWKTVEGKKKESNLKSNAQKRRKKRVLTEIIEFYESHRGGGCYLTHLEKSIPSLNTEKICAVLEQLIEEGKIEKNNYLYYPKKD